eukprot:14660010-Alexandrium_andersonii.AAC.1
MCSSTLAGWTKAVSHCEADAHSLSASRSQRGRVLSACVSRSARASCGASLARASAAVSYTHLTLPTICSV